MTVHTERKRQINVKIYWPIASKMKQQIKEISKQRLFNDYTCIQGFQTGVGVNSQQIIKEIKN